MWEWFLEKVLFEKMEKSHLIEKIAYSFFGAKRPIKIRVFGALKDKNKTCTKMKKSGKVFENISHKRSQRPSVG